MCVTVVLKLATKAFLTCIFKHSERNDLIFFGRFKNVSVYDQKKQDESAMTLKVLYFKE